MPNDALITISSRHAAHFERLKSGESKKFDKFLKQIDKDIRAQLSKLDLTAISRKKLEQQITAIDKLLNGTFADYQKVWDASIKEVAAYEAGFEIRSLEQVVNGVSFTLPSDAQISAAVFATPLAGIKGPYGGSLLKPFYKNYSATEIRRIEGAIRSGYYNGKTTSQILKDIRGTKAAGFKDGIIYNTSKEVRKMTHTALQHAAVTAREQVWQDNSDVVKKWRFTATLDSSTSPICRPLDGTVWDIGKGPRLPLHPGERSTMTAVLDDEFAFLSEGGTRSARTPEGDVVSVSSKQTYYSWLKNQPKGYQESVLGRDRTKLFREGGLSAERFAELGLNKNFEPTTLKEMYEMEPLAFEKAGVTVN